MEHKEMKDYEIISVVHDLLKECPSCHGNLRKFKDWKLRCNLCDLEITITTRKERMFIWILYGSIFPVSLGVLVGMVL